MGLEIHLRIEYNEFLLQALVVQTREVVLVEMSLQSIIIEIILRVLASGPSIAKMAALVLVATMCVQFIIAIESFSTEATFRMTVESTLIDCSRIVVAKLLMLP
jgi:hypothetical protein